jgi:hypothetical protein
MWPKKTGKSKNNDALKQFRAMFLLQNNSVLIQALAMG